MQRWEYKVLILDTGGTMPLFGYNSVLARWVDGQEIRDWKKLGLTQALNSFGNDGWELVSTSYEPPRQLMVFKRPLS